MVLNSVLHLESLTGLFKLLKGFNRVDKLDWVKFIMIFLASANELD